MTTLLYGYHQSVYTWIARFALAQKGVKYESVEVNPFASNLDPAYGERHPFLRVPVLEHEGANVYETAAITQFVDEAFDGPALQPVSPLGRARMRQSIAVVDAYGYWPLVRQVYSHSILAPLYGQPTDHRELAAGLAAARGVLRALEGLVGLDGVLDGRSVTLADVHLCPMVGCFARAPEGNEMLEDYARLTGWWQWARNLTALRATEPALPRQR